MIQLPTNRLGTKQIQTTKRNVPLDQIVAVESQNPLATGVEALGSTIGKTLQQRAALRQQGQQLAALGKIIGQDIPADAGLTPDTALQAIQTKTALQKLNSEGKKKPLGEPFKGTDGKTYQYFYDEKTEKTTAEPLSLGLPPPKPKPPGTLVPTGQYDDKGQPIVYDNKEGVAKVIPLPQGTIGKTQTKAQLTPTSQARSAGEFAATILPHIDDLKGLISQADAKGYIGPMGGRYQNFMTGKVGTTGDKDADYMLGKLKSTRDFLATGTMKAHVGARGGGDLLEHFLSDMDTGKQSAQVLYGELDALKPFMEGYVAAGKGTHLTPLPAPLTGAKKSLADKLGL